MSNTNIYAKLLLVQQEIEPIKKTEDNPYYKSKYVDINGILAVLKPILNKHGLVLTQAFRTSIGADGKNRLETAITDAESGEQLDSYVNLPDTTDPQKFGSAVTYYRRYALQSLFALEAEDDDGNIATTHTPLKATETIAPLDASGGRTLYKTPAAKLAPPWKPKPRTQPEAEETLIDLND